MRNNLLAIAIAIIMDIFREDGTTIKMFKNITNQLTDFTKGILDERKKNGSNKKI